MTICGVGEHLAPPGGYDPPIVDSVPYRTDGTPEELCAGWDARRRALAVDQRMADQP